jgi:hypothetical protein
MELYWVQQKMEMPKPQFDAQKVGDYISGCMKNDGAVTINLAIFTKTDRLTRKPWMCSRKCGNAPGRSPNEPAVFLEQANEPMDDCVVGRYSACN